MAKRKLTKKLKEQIKQKPYRLKKSDFSGEALEYLNRIRGARKAVKTKEKKAKYKAPRLKSQGRPQTVEDLYNVLLKKSGLTKKQFAKKYPDAAGHMKKQKIAGNRELEMLKQDIEFSLPPGAKVYINGKRASKVKAINYLVRLKGRIMRTGLTYERISVEYTYDAKGNIYIKIPTPADFASAGREAGDENRDEETLDFIQENYPIQFYRR